MPGNAGAAGLIATGLVMGLGEMLGSMQRKRALQDKYDTEQKAKGAAGLMTESDIASIDPKSWARWAGGDKKQGEALKQQYMMAAKVRNTVASLKMQGMATGQFDPTRATGPQGPEWLARQLITSGLPPGLAEPEVEAAEKGAEPMQKERFGLRGKEVAAQARTTAATTAAKASVKKQQLANQARIQAQGMADATSRANRLDADKTAIQVAQSRVGAAGTRATKMLDTLSKKMPGMVKSAGTALLGVMKNMNTHLSQNQRTEDVQQATDSAIANNANQMEPIIAQDPDVVGGYISPDQGFFNLLKGMSDKLIMVDPGDRKFIGGTDAKAMTVKQYMDAHGFKLVDDPKHPGMPAAEGNVPPPAFGEFLLKLQQQVRETMTSAGTLQKMQQAFHGYATEPGETQVPETGEPGVAPEEAPAGGGAPSESAEDQSED